MHRSVPAVERASGAPTRFTLRSLLLCLALFGALLAACPVATASPSFVHGPAQACEACHHVQPSSFAPCLGCHESAETPNLACVTCHPGKQTAGKTCWACHAPGAEMPAPADQACEGCHGVTPHLGASAACTSCHGTSPTPHHDALDQQAPETCTDCHQHAERQTHDGLACTACHATDVHPDRPSTPGACAPCHPSSTFGGADCLSCHAGSPFNGVVDNDLHDATLPDAPISGRSCTSCHPGRQKHAGGAAGCRDCHDSADAFHHGTAASPGYPACADCHGTKRQHGSGLPCEDCHAGAQHQSAPPTPDATTCNRCHAATDFGTGGCYRCHSTPVYHVAPAVGSCASCHGNSRSRHAGAVGCTTCHRNIDRGHHRGTVSSLSCGARGCHTQEKHVGQVRCASCHGRAQHDRTPLNLPADTWSVCGRCHAFTDDALAAGIGPCSACHDETQHRASYRVDGCGSCHAGIEPHQDVVACESCHTDRGPGHHKVGTVGARACAECHVGVEVHASASGDPRAMSCSTCHEGSVHGLLTPVDSGGCADCHEAGSLHADGFECTDCHWPAVHASVPEPALYGPHRPLPLQLPPIDSGETTDTTAPRDEFTDTGVDLVALAGIGLLLMAGGVGFRLEERRRRR